MSIVMISFAPESFICGFVQCADYACVFRTWKRR